MVLPFACRAVPTVVGKAEALHTLLHVSVVVRTWRTRLSSLGWALMLGVLFGVFTSACHETDRTSSEPTPKSSSLSDRELAEQYCSGCHQFTEPELLRKSFWEEAVLPRMGRRLGIFEEQSRSANSFAQGFEGVRAKASDLFPSSPRLSREKWNRIVRYFLENAPTTPPGSGGPSEHQKDPRSVSDS